MFLVIEQKIEIQPVLSEAECRSTTELGNRQVREPNVYSLLDYETTVRYGECKAWITRGQVQYESGPGQFWGHMIR